MTKKKRSSTTSSPNVNNGTLSTNSTNSAVINRPKSLNTKAWCWYCDRDFDNDAVLIQHQKARHFKCNHCHRKLNSASGLVIHAAQVHKITMEKVPNSITGHDTPEMEIYGMEGVPRGDIERHQQGLPPVPYKRPKFLESGGLLPLLAAQKASSGAISITGQSTFFDDENVGVLANATPYVISNATPSSFTPGLSMYAPPVPYPQQSYNGYSGSVYPPQ